MHGQTWTVLYNRLQDLENTRSNLNSFIQYTPRPGEHVVKFERFYTIDCRTWRILGQTWTFLWNRLQYLENTRSNFNSFIQWTPGPGEYLVKLKQFYTIDCRTWRILSQTWTFLWNRLQDLENTLKYEGTLKNYVYLYI